MFLAWLNQIVALLDKTEGVFSILSNIAKDYPQALIYPLRISSEQFSFENSPEGKRRKNELTRYFYFYRFISLIEGHIISKYNLLAN